MNNVYFKCETCKIYIDAGYRWAYWHLEEPKIVTHKKPISVEQILNCRKYWAGEKVDKSLAEHLHKVHQFLIRHRQHTITYGETDFFFKDSKKPAYLEWMCETDDEFELLPRFFVERLSFTKWEQVAAYISPLEIGPWWWDNYENAREKVKEKFLQLVAEKTFPTTNMIPPGCKLKERNPT